MVHLYAFSVKGLGSWSYTNLSTLRIKKRIFGFFHKVTFNISRFVKPDLYCSWRQFFFFFKNTIGLEKHPTKIFILLRKSTEQDISSSECSLVFYSDCWSRTHPPAVKCQAPISCTSSWLSQWSEIRFPSQKTDYWHSEVVVKIGLGSVGLHLMKHCFCWRLFSELLT